MKRSFGMFQPLPTFCLLTALLCLAPLTGQADDYTCITNNGTITITKYIGAGGDVSIPDTINGLPVVAIGYHAFSCTNVANVTVPVTLTSIDGYGFAGCDSLRSISLPHSVTNLGIGAFYHCDALTNVILGNGIGVLETCAFWSCSNLTAIIIPDSVTSVGAAAFQYCTRLATVVVGRGVRSFGNSAFAGCRSGPFFYFRGDAPFLGWNVFDGVYWATACYLPGTSNWEYFFGNTYPPTIFDPVPWFLPTPLILTLPPSFGVQSNQFGFRISWATNASVAIEACANLDGGAWSPLATNTLIEDGWTYFSDPDWTNHPARFYRVRSP